MILSMGLFYGGMTQIMVGLMEAKKGNTFGLVAFISYGIFWVSFVAINVFPAMGWMAAASEGGMIAYLCDVVHIFNHTVCRNLKVE